MSKYEIKTPTGVAGVRGTSFTMGSDGSIICYSGSVVVSFPGANGQITTQVVNAGDQFDPATGQVTSLVPPGQSVADWAATATPANALTEATTFTTKAGTTGTATPYISP
jgi:hypothetical protein